ncbi:MAG: DHHA1 domain-containing protein [Candidatus Alcyoniella australis]|nr:DHHA1 domain-containing protein [Candidatus Alcyoniella australis]
MIGDRETLLAAAEALRNARRALVIAHANPEGDAIGATLGLGAVLELLGAQVVCANQDPLPKTLGFLPGSDRLVASELDPQQFDLVAVVDCGALHRVGRIADKLADHPNLLNFDHHLSNDGFGTLAYVDPQASSTGEVLWRLIKTADLPADQRVAANLYTAIYTDTTQLSNGACTPAAFAACGELMALGADPVGTARELYQRQTASRLKLLGRALLTLDLHGGRFASVVVTQSDFDKTEATVDDLEGFVELVRSINGVEVAMLVREAPGGKTKASLRSNGPIDVSAVASKLGGGGHRAAAGLTTDLPLEQAISRLLEIIGDHAG